MLAIGVLLIIAIINMVHGNCPWNDEYKSKDKDKDEPRWTEDDLEYMLDGRIGMSRVDRKRIMKM
jgi:hypothetical protein